MRADDIASLITDKGAISRPARADRYIYFWTFVCAYYVAKNSKSLRLTFATIFTTLQSRVGVYQDPAPSEVALPTEACYTKGAFSRIRCINTTQHPRRPFCKHKGISQCLIESQERTTKSLDQPHNEIVHGCYRSGRSDSERITL